MILPATRQGCKASMGTDWGVDETRRIYNVGRWNGGYFEVDDDGHLYMQVPGRRGPRIDMYAMTEAIQQEGLQLPVLARFPDILDDRVQRLVEAFGRAREAVGFNGSYTAVYPIKVNQQRSVVERLLRYGGERVGLEAGSKPELMAVMALSRPGGVIICNGYKDREYLRLALIARLLGHRAYIVLEKPSELEDLARESRALGVRPLLGMRVRLASIGAGKWQNTGGEKAKFGLSAAQVLGLLDRLRALEMLDCVELMHFHMGSQIANIRDIQRAMREAARYYAELRRLGAPVGVVDAGGGLGVDYEGTQSRNFCSINYSLQEYANNIVRPLWETCVEHDLPHPELITEAGRAMTAHHAVLITDVIDCERSGGDDTPSPPAAAEPLILQDLWRLYANEDAMAATERYHDAAHWLAEAQAMYTHGVLDLEQRARAEELYLATCRRLLQAMRSDNRLHREILDELHEKLADKYFCNFSVFQSIPDVWAIDQIFPILPLHRLDEAPTRRAILQDLTCDSDGQVSYYVDREGIETTLPLHPLRPGEPYLLGIFLVGAYQEILGDMHNLFGDTNSVDVERTADGYRLHRSEHGDTVDELLRHVHFDPAELMATFRDKVAQAGLPDDRSQHVLATLQAGMSGYTYLED